MVPVVSLPRHHKEGALLSGSCLTAAKLSMPPSSLSSTPGAKKLKFTLELERHYILRYKLPRAGRTAQRNMIAGSGLEEAISHTVGRPLVPPPPSNPGERIHTNQ